MDSEVTVYLFIFVVCFSCYFYLKWLWRRRRLYYYASKIKGPLSFPIIGSAYILLGRTQNILESGINLIDKYKHLFKFWLGPKLWFFITKPDHLQIVLNSALEKADGYKFLIPVFGDGLATLPVERWRKHRKIIGLTFNQQILNSFTDVFVEYSNILVQKLKDIPFEECTNLFPLLTQCTLDIICATTMGTKVNAMTTKSQYILWISRAAELGIIRIFNILLHPNFLWKLTPFYKEMNDISEKMHDYVKKIIDSKRREKIQSIEKTPLKSKIFLNYLLAMTDNDGKWSDNESIEETRTIIIGGSDATALTAGYVLMMLGMHQEIQEKTYKEITSVFEGSTRNATPQDLQKMEYLERVIKETLRLFPVVTAIARQLTEDIVLGNDVLPKGSSVVIPIIYVHRDPDYWNDPLKFDPDRFLPDEVSNRHPYSYIPFSRGPRNCIGYRYAMMALKIILSTILRHYKVAETGYNTISEIELKFDVATKCVKGQNVRLEFRKSH